MKPRFRIEFWGEDNEYCGGAGVEAHIGAIGAIVRAVLRAEPVKEVRVLEIMDDGEDLVLETKRGEELKWK